MSDVHHGQLSVRGTLMRNQDPCWTGVANATERLCLSNRAKIATPVRSLSIIVHGKTEDDTAAGVVQ